MESTRTPQAWFLQSSYPVLFPSHEALTKPQAEFESFIKEELSRSHAETADEEDDASMVEETEVDESETFTMVSATTSEEISKVLTGMEIDPPEAVTYKPSKPEPPKVAHPFMRGLVNHGKRPQAPDPNLENMMRTENNDLAYRSSGDSLVDLFTELEEVISGPLLSELLTSAWKVDSLATLKIIFNARSIHLGKSSRTTFYRAAGWLAQNHPLTLVANLRWLSRPVIEKKAKKEGDGDLVIVDEKDENDPSRFDVRNGVAHGYWKDLLNLVALAANKKLGVLSNPRDVLNSENPGILRGKSIKKARAGGGRMVRGSAAGRARGGARGPRGPRGRGRGGMSRGGASMREGLTSDSAVKKTKPAKNVDPKAVRHEKRDERHGNAVDEFNTNPVYRALHMTVARLFAEQLEKDVAALRGADPKAKRSISLCGKWAPSHDHFHDRHTFIVSTIAEILYPRERLDKVDPTDSRETYLRHAREMYRRDTSALRKHLEIVEREITEEKFENIKYDRIPSVAMKNYSKLFIEKDMDRFEKYIDRVAEGKAKISGATLLPSTLMLSVKALARNSYELSAEDKARMTPAQLIERKVQAIEGKVIDGQWNSLVQRIKDSGTLDNCIAVCDTSGSMESPIFPDKTSPMESSLGLSLLIAEVAKPPFGGAFISFSSVPVVHQIDLNASLVEKYQRLQKQNWGMNTNFVSVFEDLILPMALKNKLSQEDMVKRVFVFSDMQFDEAGHTAPYSWGQARPDVPDWTTSYERIQKKFKLYGYEMPELVFWNLAGGRAGYQNSTDEGGDPTAPKPVSAADEGTCLVSGYSQGMLKVFMDNGSFEDPEEEEDSDEEVVVSKDGEENVTMEQPKKKKAKMDPLSVVKKAIGHKAYDMLKVVD